MAVDLTGFRTRFTEFASTATFPDATVQLALDDAQLQINRCSWGNKADLGTYYLAAHSLLVNAPTYTNVITGAVTGETVGSVSRTYAGPLGYLQEMGDFAWTKYGILYWRLKRQIVASPVVL